MELKVAAESGSGGRHPQAAHMIGVSVKKSAPSN